MTCELCGAERPQPQMTVGPLWVEEESRYRIVTRCKDQGLCSNTDQRGVTR